MLSIFIFKGLLHDVLPFGKMHQPPNRRLVLTLKRLSCQPVSMATVMTVIALFLTLIVPAIAVSPMPP
jgi:hypothetical protein